MAAALWRHTHGSLARASERAQPVITKSAKAPKLQEDKRMHASGFYEPEAGEVRKEIGIHRGSQGNEREGKAQEK